MRILVISDAHGNDALLKKVIEREKECKTIFYLGDGATGAKILSLDYKDKEFIILKGNNDIGEYPEEIIKEIAGVKILATHGHRYFVKYSYDKLYFAALKNDVKLVLFGHTHKKESIYNNGVYLVNPGSLRSPYMYFDYTYAVIDIIDGKIMPIIKKIEN